MPFSLMAIAHVGTTVNTGNVSTLTISSHVVSGANPCLIVKVAGRDTTDTVTGVTWNTTEDLDLVSRDRNGDSFSEMWVLANPTATTANVVVSLTGTGRTVGAASTYSGCDQATPVRAAGVTTANGTDAAPTTDVVANADEMVVDSLGQVSAGPDTAAGDHNERHDDSFVGGGTDTRGASQDVLSAGATETMGWTMGGSDNWAIVAAPLQEPFTPPAGTGIPIIAMKPVIQVPNTRLSY